MEEAETRSERITVRLTPREREVIRSAARKADRKEADYARLKLLSQPERVFNTDTFAHSEAA